MNSASTLYQHFIKAQRNRLVESRSIWILAAWTVSVVFHPLLMPTYLHGVVFKYCTDLVPLTREAKVQMLQFIFISTYIIPVLASGLLWVTGIISSLSIEKQSERLIPLLITGLIYTGVSYIFLEYLDMARMLGLFMGIVALAVILTAGITHFWKISAHMVGMGGLVGFMLSVVDQTRNSALLWPLMGTILAAGFVASARLLLNAHSAAQVVAGFLFGVAVSWTAVYFFV